MKLDKDSVLKMGDHTFKFEDIETIEMAGGWLRIKGMGKWGMNIQAEIQLKGVEFLNPTNVTDEDIIEITHQNLSGDEVKRETATAWVGDHKSDIEIVSPLGAVKQAFNEAFKEPESKTATEAPKAETPLPEMTKESAKKVIEDMLQQAVLDAEAADRRYLAKIIIDMIRSGG